MLTCTCTLRRCLLASLLLAVAAPGIAAATHSRPQRVELGDGIVADLGLERVDAGTRNTQFVVGAAQAPYDYDHSRVAIYRGSLDGHPGSHAFLAVSPSRTVGYVDLAGGRDRYWINTSTDDDGNVLPARRATSPRSLPPGIQLCGALANDDVPPAAPAMGGLPEKLRVIELAFETDFELFSLFNDLDETADYITMLVAALNDICLRDVNAMFDLTFVRLWDTADDLFNEPDPLGPFQNHWNNQMGGVHRDVAQFVSGRRDLPYGGIAYLGALCGSSAYSVVGYMLGFFPDPSGPDGYHYDIMVVAHELGHNVDASHTHSYGIDNCDDLDGDAQRGTIMSYCSQTRSGGNANVDLRFHSIVQGAIQNYLAGVNCIFTDCNGNGTADNMDIALGNSADDNGNGIPDECEDCNNNGVLDPDDIANGDSADVNGNTVPDECEPDCNGNGVPDEHDIFLGTSQDIHGNNIPDECEADCDANDIADYNQIMADMFLDVDRNAVLDSCQDCDGDGVTDFEVLDGAYNVWVTNYDAPDVLNEFHAGSGAPVKNSRPGVVNNGNDLIITPDRRILVTSSNDDRVVELTSDGTVVGDLVTPGLGGLDHPATMTLTPKGTLLVASRDTNSVIEYDAQTGALIGNFVSPGDGGLVGPFGIAFGPDGQLYVTSDDDTILRYDGSGDFVDQFSDPGGAVKDFRGILFKPDGNLLITSLALNGVYELDGATGAMLGQFDNGGTETALTLDDPWCLRLAPGGNVIVSRHDIAGSHEDGGHLETGGIIQLHINSTRLFEYDIENGNFIRSMVLGNDTELWSPTGFDFMPDPGVDCNFNLMPDSCDIASGVSQDRNGNGLPDECETLAGDLDGDGDVDPADLVLLLGAWGPCDDCANCPADLDGDCIVGTPDLIVLLGNWG